MAMALAEQPKAGLRLADDEAATMVEQLVIGGDLSKLTAAQRVTYYRAVCESVGLNPLTKPFDYITLNGRLTLYPTKGATDQVRSVRGIHVTRLERERADDLAIVTAYGRDRHGRQDSSTGAVSIKGLQGEALANALMKAETKAKRRLTLSLAGLGMLDEVEVEATPGAWRQEVDAETGELLDGGQPVVSTPATLTERMAAKAAVVVTPDEPVAPQVPGEVEAVPLPPSPDDAATLGVAASAGSVAEHGTVMDTDPVTQCEAESDPRMPPVERCRLVAGHRGSHRTSEMTWPNTGGGK